MKNLNAHLFRQDGADHIILSTRGRIHRTVRPTDHPNGNRLLCGPKLTTKAQRITAVTRGCDKCLRSFNGVVDLCERGES